MGGKKKTKLSGEKKSRSGGGNFQNAKTACESRGRAAFILYIFRVYSRKCCWGFLAESAIATIVFCSMGSVCCESGSIEDSDMRSFFPRVAR